MAVRKPLVLVGTSIQELPSTDFLPAANVPEVTAQHIHAAPSKDTPADADELGLSDSAASWGLKKLTFANLKTWLGGLFVGKDGGTISGSLSVTGNLSLGSSATGAKLTTEMSSGPALVQMLLTGLTPNVGDYHELRFQAAPTVSTIRAGLRAVRRAVADYGAHLSFLTENAANVYAERLRIEADGNVLVVGGGGLGYGVGSGGTVTQATSKITAVTLNKPCGQITLNNSVLGAGVSARFNVSNSYVGINDTVTVNIAGGVANYESYTVDASIPGVAGAFTVVIKNISGASLSEAVVLNYTVHKGSAS